MLNEEIIKKNSSLLLLTCMLVKDYESNKNSEYEKQKYWLFLNNCSFDELKIIYGFWWLGADCLSLELYPEQDFDIYNTDLSEEEKTYKKITVDNLDDYLKDSKGQFSDKTTLIDTLMREFHYSGLFKALELANIDVSILD
jgi:hypothetical protein